MVKFLAERVGVGVCTPPQSTPQKASARSCQKISTSFDDIINLFLRHEHFITTSEWVNDQIKSSFVSESPTSKYFSKVLHVLSKLVNFEKSDSNILKISIDWFQSISSHSQSYISRIIDRKEFLEVRKSVLYAFMSVSYTQPSLGKLF